MDVIVILKYFNYTMFVKNKKNKELNNGFSAEGGIEGKKAEQESFKKEIQEFGVDKKKFEAQRERTVQQKEELLRVNRQEVEESESASVVSSMSKSSDGQMPFDVKDVESILQDGLEDTYKKMDPISQAQFKSQGEDTAKAVTLLMSKAKVKIKEIVDLIVKWLKLIPGVNKFFVEQEAKIKADRLMQEKRRRDDEV